MYLDKIIHINQKTEIKMTAATVTETSLLHPGADSFWCQQHFWRMFLKFCGQHCPLTDRHTGKHRGEEPGKMHTLSL